jgi:hypothetical protein
VARRSAVAENGGHESAPGTVLTVFSSLTQYGITAEQDQARFGALYERGGEMEGVDYVGPVPEPELAQQLRAVGVSQHFRGNS